MIAAGQRMLWCCVYEWNKNIERTSEKRAVPEVPCKSAACGVRGRLFFASAGCGAERGRTAQGRCNGGRVFSRCARYLGTTGHRLGTAGHRLSFFVCGSL